MGAGVGVLVLVGAAVLEAAEVVDAGVAGSQIAASSYPPP